jgi:hypothetical protein
MSSYLARLKQLQSEKNSLYIPDPVPPKPPKAPFDPFDGTPRHVNVKNISDDERLREARKERVMALLQENPDAPRAIYADTDSDPLNVVLVTAVRHVAVSEMTVPRVKYDPWRLITILDKEIH